MSVAALTYSDFCMLNEKAPGPNALAASQAAAKPEQVSDSLSLSERALQELKSDQKRPGVISPDAVLDANATPAQKALFQQVLSGYESAQRKVDDTPFKPEYQSYVNLINDPGASDADKLKAYTSFKLASAFEHAQSGQIGISATDFKFDWLTRNSDFLVRAHADDSAFDALAERETSAADQSGQGIDLDQNTAGQIDVIARLNPVEQGVATVDLLYDKLSWGLASADLDKEMTDPRNQNTAAVPGGVATVAYPADPKTVIAKMVSSTLSALSHSQAGRADSSGNSAFVKLFTGIVSNVQTQATQRAQSFVRTPSKVDLTT